MNGKRLISAVVYVLISAVLLWCIWIGFEKPLPWRWDFRRAERAMLLENMEILRYDRDNGIVVAANDELLALHGQKRNTTTGIFKHEFQLFPLEQGAGAAVWGNWWGWTVSVCGYETSGTAAWAELNLSLQQNGTVLSTLHQTARKEDHAFFFRLAEGSCSFTGEQWPIDALSDVVLLNRNPQTEVPTAYTMTITFYDESGIVTAVYETGGGNTHEN